MDPNLLSKHQRARKLLRPLSEGLSSFRAVYAGEAYPHLPLRRREDGNGIPVGDFDAAAAQGFRRGGRYQDNYYHNCNETPFTTSPDSL